MVVAEFAITSKRGAMESKTQKNITKFYNLDVIISVGYRVKSQHENCYCENLKSFKSDAHFVLMKGRFYNQNTKKFMIIGRAPNGWGTLDTSSEKVFGAEAEKQFNDCERWNWIVNVEGSLYSKYDEVTEGGRYCLDNKAYWNYAKAIWEQLPGEIKETEIWMENIVWSNLYKVSPVDGYNPDDKSMKTQLEACKEILKEELEICKPTHILIMSGYDWFEPFADIFENVESAGECNILKGDNKNDIYVEGTALYKNAKVIIACRPEWREKEAYVSAIVNAFKK